jgi:hypothetical protein
MKTSGNPLDVMDVLTASLRCMAISDNTGILAIPNVTPPT